MITTPLMLHRPHSRLAVRLLPAVLFAGLVLAGCRGGRTLLLDQRLAEAPALKAECVRLGLESDLITRAANLTTAADRLLVEGKREEAVPMLDHAVAIYQLELLKHQLSTVRDNKADIEAQIGLARGKLQTYERVLEQLKGER